MSASPLFNLHGGCCMKKGGKEQPTPVGYDYFKPAKEDAPPSKPTNQSHIILSTVKCPELRGCSTDSFRAVLPGMEEPSTAPFPAEASQHPAAQQRVPHTPKKGQWESSLLRHGSLLFLSDPPHLGFSPLLPFMLAGPFLLTNSPTRLRKVPPTTDLHRGFMSPALRGRSLGINHRILKKVICIYYT